MRLIELLKTIPKSDFLSPDGFLFSKMGKDGVFDWLDFSEGQILDNMYFFQFSGDKDIQDFFRKYADYYREELVIGDDVLVGEHIVGEVVTKVMPFVATECVLKFKMKWNRLHKIFESQVNPLLNEYYKILETPNLTKQTDVGVNTNITSSVTGSANVDTYGFNSTSSVPQGESGNTNTQTTTGSSDDNNSSTTETQSGNKVTEYEGIRGKSQAELLEKEIEVMKWNFYEQLFEDVDTLITLPKYTL